MNSKLTNYQSEMTNICFDYTIIFTTKPRFVGQQLGELETSQITPHTAVLTNTAQMWEPEANKMDEK